MNLRRRLFSITILALALGVPECALARIQAPVARQLEDIPMYRVISNLERLVSLNPQEAWTRLDLARAHALTYALGSSEATYSFEKGKITNVPQPTGSVVKYGEASKDARMHLRKAIVVYGEVLGMIPNNDIRFPVAHLGRGWCLQQMGNKPAAIEDYRILLKKYDASTGRVEELKPASEWTGIDFEAAGYLVELLDPGRDAAEIAQLKKMRGLYQQENNRIPPFQTPIAIPLDRNTPLAGIEDSSARVAFDVDARHPGQHWSWITPKAGWLAYDPKKTGKIVSGIRLFGNVSYWMFWDNGYQAMSALDDNGDGVLSGKELEGLVVWVDENRNGVCDPGELKSLAELHIKALSYKHVPLPGHPDHIVYSPQGVQYDDGTSGPSYDIILHAKP